MEERKDPQTTEGRDAEATSEETLSDLEATTKVKGDRRDASAGESGSASSVPAPDGVSGEGRGETADERETGDPM
ncbi:MAG TPA: hypothetical protein VER08_06190 [Pyrinomonadaceae bacterium]|nr:hypothetical protein [Pyrinomonadaceae bacterium]